MADVQPSGVEWHWASVINGDGTYIDIFLTLAVNNRRVTVRAVNGSDQDAPLVVRTPTEELVIQIPPGETTRTLGALRWEDLSGLQLSGAP